MEESKEAICTQFRWGVPHRRLAANFNIDRNTLYRYLVRWGCYDTQDADGGEARKKRLRDHKEKEAARKREEYRSQYKEGSYEPVPLDREKTLKLIRSGLTLPKIASEFPEFSYEQVYDTFMTDRGI